jgi:hypothetical protein
VIDFLLYIVAPVFAIIALVLLGFVGYVVLIDPILPPPPGQGGFDDKGRPL